MNARIIRGAIFLLMITPFSIVTKGYGVMCCDFELSILVYAVKSRERTRKSLEKP